MPSETLTVRAKYIASRGFLSLSKSQSWGLMILITSLGFFIFMPFWDHYVEYIYSRATRYEYLYPLKKGEDFLYYYLCLSLFILCLVVLSHTVVSAFRKETVFLVHFGTNTGYTVSEYGKSIDNNIRDKNDLLLSITVKNSEVRIDKTKIFLPSEPGKPFWRHEPIDLFELGFAFHLINCFGLLVDNEECSISFIKNELNLSNFQTQILLNALFDLGVLKKSTDEELLKPLINLSEFITKLENIGSLNEITSVKIRL